MFPSLVGLAEISAMVNTNTSSKVNNWRKRYADFPKPVAELRMGPVFLEYEIKNWIKTRHPSERKKAWAALGE